jgi:hypothetical protein
MFRFPTCVEELCCTPIADDLAKLGQLDDTAAVDQVGKEELSNILEHSPDDEIEGEIVYLQSRLLDGVVPLKQRYGKGTFLFVICAIISYAGEPKNDVD